jgi:hypothetical protein
MTAYVIILKFNVLIFLTLLGEMQELFLEHKQFQKVFTWHLEVLFIENRGEF